MQENEDAIANPKDNTSRCGREREKINYCLYHLQMRKTSAIFNPWAYGVNATPSMEAKGQRRLEDQTLGFSTHNPRSSLLGKKP
jgi:hypothetical protein